jgi:excisionase family DNA binding protein
VKSLARLVHPPAIGRHTRYDDLPQFLKVEELARYLGIGRGHCYALIRSGQIASVRFGRLVRIDKQALK